MKTSRNTPEQQAEIVRRYERGEPAKVLAAEFGVCEGSIKLYVSRLAQSACCQLCRVTLPLSAFGVLQTSIRMQRDPVCMGCRETKPVKGAYVNYSKPKAEPKAPAAPKYIGEPALGAHLVQASLKHEPRADGRLCAHNELELRGPVPRPGSASPRLEQCIKTFGGR